MVRSFNYDTQQPLMEFQVGECRCRIVSRIAIARVIADRIIAGEQRKISHVSSKSLVLSFSSRSFSFITFQSRSGLNSLVNAWINENTQLVLLYVSQVKSDKRHSGFAISTFESGVFHLKKLRSNHDTFPSLKPFPGLEVIPNENCKTLTVNLRELVYSFDLNSDKRRKL
ncbi:hypothetical protein HZH66_014161 [Vespula vulgaris]|uniref:Uncharacterized protein n=1 Tax=Vespula vulgaris TaxID=7454 RepID=A0A834J3D7_VESVU|nr:hypothetical protein HZH66_014161 [Vespula vulgaris]